MKTRVLFSGIIMLAIQLPSISVAATDTIYNLFEITSNPSTTWDGTNGNRLQASSIYGDERTVTFNLPWDFIFYGQTYAVGTPVTLDTNGNIWFASNITSSAHNFELNTTLGRGPVVAAWNDDLSSAYYGGVFVQHKTDLPLGERVVVEWQTETQAEEGLFAPNNFETILFKDGRIRIDYKAMKTNLGSDNGSGISHGANNTYLSLSSNYSPVPTITTSTLRSFLFEPIPAAINIQFSGTGSGSIAFDLSSTVCNSNCSENFLRAQKVTLTPLPDQYSVFVGWTGADCTIIGNKCQLSLSNDVTLTAAFDPAVSKLSGTFYSSVQDAYNHSTTGDTIYAWDVEFNGGLLCDQARDVTILGGYDKLYSTVVGTTRLTNPLIISAGSVRVSDLVITGGTATTPLATSSTLAMQPVVAEALAATSTSGPALVAGKGTKNKKTHHDKHLKNNGLDRLE